MKNIILFLVKESNLHTFKACDPKTFFEEFRTYKRFDVAEALPFDQSCNLFINDEGFVKLPRQSNGDFFNILLNGVSAEETLENFLKVDTLTFPSHMSKENTHLFAFYDTDIEEFKKTPKLFTLMSKAITKNKKNNLIGFGDVISLRIYKEPASPILYMANIPKSLSLFVEINQELITFFATSNVKASAVEEIK